jgi:hypothetical protein
VGTGDRGYSYGDRYTSDAMFAPLCFRTMEDAS